MLLWQFVSCSVHFFWQDNIQTAGTILRPMCRNQQASVATGGAHPTIPRPSWVMEFPQIRSFFGGVGEMVDGLAATDLRRKAFDGCKLSVGLYIWLLVASTPEPPTGLRPLCPRWLYRAWLRHWQNLSTHRSRLIRKYGLHVLRKYLLSDRFLQGRSQGFLLGGRPSPPFPLLFPSLFFPSFPIPSFSSQI